MGLYNQNLDMLAAYWRSRQLTVELDRTEQEEEVDIFAEVKYERENR